jgi:hypothetical protein
MITVCTGCLLYVHRPPYPCDLRRDVETPRVGHGAPTAFVDAIVVRDGPSALSRVAATIRRGAPNGSRGRGNLRAAPPRLDRASACWHTLHNLCQS